MCEKIAKFVAFAVAGTFGIAMAVMGMLSTAGMIVAIDSFGPVTDNAGGIAEMAELEVRRQFHERAKTQWAATWPAVPGIMPRSLLKSVIMAVILKIMSPGASTGSFFIFNKYSPPKYVN